VPPEERIEGGLIEVKAFGIKYLTPTPASVGGEIEYERAMKFPVSIYEDEDGMHIAECPSIPGCVGQGRTEVEAEANLAGAIKECLAVRAEKGLPLTVTIRELEVPV
jgi:predicted RNase H-like HicB family nuclease